MVFSPSVKVIAISLNEIDSAATVVFFLSEVGVFPPKVERFAKTMAIIMAAMATTITAIQEIKITFLFLLEGAGAGALTATVGAGAGVASVLAPHEGQKATPSGN